MEKYFVSVQHVEGLKFIMSIFSFKFFRYVPDIMSFILMPFIRVFGIKSHFTFGALLLHIDQWRYQFLFSMLFHMIVVLFASCPISLAN